MLDENDARKLRREIEISRRRSCGAMASRGREQCGAKFPIG
jgi:hypothetical protein